MSDVVVRAPGRVNLIGEHTDYMHLPVLPMAIQRGITIRAVPMNRPGVVATSTLYRDPVEINPSSPVPEGWARYLAGALRELGPAVVGRGAELLIDTDLPATGGLSSSSALTTGVMKALAVLWDLALDDEVLVEKAIAAERVVGVESGGMDQTVIMFAEAGAALRIDWAPHKRGLVPIPGGFRFVIGYSGDAAPKGGASRDHYNERVVACRAAAVLLERATGRSAGSPPVLAPYAGIDVGDVELPVEATANVVALDAGVDVERLVSLTTGRFDPAQPLGVDAAARHVITEASRVDAAEVAIRSGDLAGLGALLDASHASLRSYGVSTSRLDRLTEAARDAGAAGARLTGAGFGGWAVAACDPARVEAVTEAMIRSGEGLAFEVFASRGIH